MGYRGGPPIKKWGPIYFLFIFYFVQGVVGQQRGGAIGGQSPPLTPPEELEGRAQSALNLLLQNIP